MMISTIKDLGLEKEGTGHLVLHGKREEYSEFANIDDGWQRAYAKITAGHRTVAGIVEAVKPGPNHVFIDPYLRRDLAVAEGSPVEIEPLKPLAAAEVEIAFPPTVDVQEIAALCRTYLFQQPLSQGLSKPLYLYSGEPIVIEIVRVVPEDFRIFTEETRVVTSKKQASGQSIGFCNVGGLDREILTLRERIMRPLQHKELFHAMGIRIPRGILLSGPPGCGKTLLARALSNELGINYLEIRGPEVFMGVYGESEKRVRELFEEARKNAPSLLLIDEIDAIAPSRQSTRGELERRIVTSLLAEMDGLKDGGDIVVVATTNEPDSLDAALRRPGRFDFELHFGAPDSAARLQILKIHSARIPMEGVSLETVAGRAHGYSGADLMNLCREAAFYALKRAFPEGIDVSPQALQSSKVTMQDFEIAIKSLRPSALREFAVEVPGSLNWEDVGGLEFIKQTLVEEVVKAIAEPDAFSRMDIRLPRGVLLYGPPGTGKTLLARVIANRAGANFISVRGPEILSKWLGESEQRIRKIFERARQVSPCVVFFDEIDAITGARGGSLGEASDRVVNQILTEIDGFQTDIGVCVIAATNRKDILDPALLRPGRFDYMFEVPLPSSPEREQIFRIHLKNKPLADGIDIKELASDSMTSNFSGAHIAEVCRRAALDALRENGFSSDGAKVRHEHLLSAIQAVNKNIEGLEKKIKPIGFNR